MLFKNEQVKQAKKVETIPFFRHNYTQNVCSNYIAPKQRKTHIKIFTPLFTVAIWLPQFFLICKYMFLDYKQHQTIAR